MFSPYWKDFMPKQKEGKIARMLSDFNHDRDDPKYYLEVKYFNDENFIFINRRSKPGMEKICAIFEIEDFNIQLSNKSYESKKIEQIVLFLGNGKTVYLKDSGYEVE